MPAESEKLFTTGEVGRLLGLHPATVRYRLAQRGVAVVQVHPKLFLIRASDVSRLNGSKGHAATATKH